MRGKPFIDSLHGHERGLIPAHAGKTIRKMLTLRVGTAHPRACGENALKTGKGLDTKGSSPRMRGKPRRLRTSRAGRGLIPAHAGKTPTTRATKSSNRAHPRACGENVVSVDYKQVNDGSSPRMRGKRQRFHGAGSISRLIPAHAGKTHLARFRLVCGWAHPRACGENKPTHFSTPPSSGSSPRMRGKQTALSSLDSALRLIPAHAGKTG